MTISKGMNNESRNDGQDLVAQATILPEDNQVNVKILMQDQLCLSILKDSCTNVDSKQS